MIARILFEMGAIALVLMTTPLVGAAFLWVALKFVGSRSASYMIALQAVLIGTATMVTVSVTVFQMVHHPGQDVMFAVLVTSLWAVIPGLLACVIAVTKFLGVAVAKTASAVAIAFAAGLVYFGLVMWAVPSVVLIGGLPGSPLDYYRVLTEVPWQPIDYRITELRVVSVGTVRPEDMDAVRAILGQEFHGMTVTVSDRLELPAAAFDSNRNQYNAEALLPLLAGRSENRSVRTLGVTTVDLFSPGLNFVFSSAQPKGRAAIMSLHDLQDDRRDVRLLRYRKVALRALGITFGFHSTSDRSCVMAYSNSLLDLDRKGTAWCANEAGSLRRIEGSTP